jgi:adenine deaminase
MRLGRRDLGLVAPGRRADIVLFDDLLSMRANTVLASGQVVAEGGVLTVPLRADPVPLPGDTMHVAPLVPADFRLRAAGDRARLRTVDKPRFTAWSEAAAVVENGVVRLPEHTIMMAVIHRHGRAPATPVLGFLEGWSTWRGAIATTVAHDSHNLVVFGREPADMAAAANALIACGGGMAVAAKGRVQALLALPVCGLISDAPALEVAAAFAALKAAADRIVDWQPPLLTFKAIVGASLACNPGPHVTDRGITDGSTGEVFTSALIGAA